MLSCLFQLSGTAYFLFADLFGKQVNCIVFFVILGNDFFSNDMDSLELSRSFPGDVIMGSAPLHSIVANR